MSTILKAAAREELLPRFRRVESELKADGSVVTEADWAMQQRVLEALRQNWPQIPLLGEEMAADEQQALLESSRDGLWLLDPLDGTSNYAVGIPFFCVSLALIRHGRVELGVIYDPLRDECFAAEAGRGATLNGRLLRAPLSLPPLERSMGLVDFKRLARPLATSLAERPPYASQRSFGSGALDWCMIATGRCQVYLHGGQRLWDYAAGQLILAEAGGVAATLEGEPVYQGSLAPRSVVAASSRQLFSAWRQRLEAEV
ncbi:MAG: inositol monophosphatase family protein [Pseudomonadota bacterium]